MNIEMVSSWNGYLDKFPEKYRDIYFDENYVKLYATKIDDPRCIVITENDKIYLFPILVRHIGEYKDFETAYGYGGPIANTDDSLWIKRADEKADKYLEKEGFLCGFLRFHPLIENKENVSDQTKVIYDRETVIIDTSVSPEDIWNDQISSKNRNMIRKAEKNNLIFKAEYDPQSLEEFIGLYNATMKRLNADGFYYFDKDYYRRFKSSFSNNSFLGTIRKDGKLICAALFMYYGEYGHYHLEGSDSDFSGLGANNLLLWKTACEMNRLGVKAFHLGGGYDGSPENSLLKFKKAFSKNTGEFYIGKKIFNIGAYEEISSEWERNNPEKVPVYGNRLLKYRY